MPMSKFPLFCAVAGLGLLTACAADGYRTDADSPTVSYEYNDRDDFEEVAERADDYCDDTYDRDAYLIDEDAEGSGYEATFACR